MDGTVWGRSIAQRFSLESELVLVDQEMNNAHGRQDDVSESDDLDWRRSLTMKDWSPSWTGPKSTFRESELKILELQTPGNLTPGWGELRILEL